MVDSIIILPFVWAQHGYASATDNEAMQFGSNLLMFVPVLSDRVFGDTNGYASIATQSTWITLIELLIALGIIGSSWSIGYAIGYLWRNR